MQCTRGEDAMRQGLHMCGSNIGVVEYGCGCIYRGLNICNVQGGGEWKKERQGQWGDTQENQSKAGEGKGGGGGA